MQSADDANGAEAAHQLLGQLRENLGQVIRGKGETLEVVLVAVLAGGSILLEDVPGVGKTTLAKALAQSLDLTFHRIQFTPDLLPADILGSSVYNPVEGAFRFRAGPIFCHVLLADEINRASPRTQSALLEAMSEHQVSIEGVRHTLPQPFFVLATENPVEFYGTYPLPEAQLDRFLVLLKLGYPDPEAELQILYTQQERHPLDQLQPVLNAPSLLELQARVRGVIVERSVARYLIELVQSTRTDSRLRLGVSPRGSLMLFRAAQARAFAAGRMYVLPDDIQFLSRYVLPHRVVLASQAGGITRERILEDLLARVRVPT